MDNKEVSLVLREIGAILEISGENTFKIRAYENAARAIDSLDEPVWDLVEQERLGDVRGVGKAIEEKVTILVKTGALPYLEDLKNSIPEGLLDLLKVPGIGPKKVKILYDELGIESLTGLEYAVNENRLASLKGFGKKTQENVAKGLEFIKKHAERHHIHKALFASEELVEYMKRSKFVRKIEVGGSLRRRKETVKDIDVVVASDEPEKVMSHFAGYPVAAEVLQQGETKSQVRLEGGISCDLRVVEEAQFASALHHFTGSREHNVMIRSLAKSLEMKVSEYGIFKGDEPLKTVDEKAFFRKLGLDYIPPELREGTGEIDAARENRLPALIEEKDVKGCMHVHSTWSDGTASIEEMSQAARALGYEYLGVCDHSKSAFYAGGLDEKSLKKQKAEIVELNETMVPFRILAGTEVDILRDGSLDFSDEALENLDFVIASVHSVMSLSEKEMTARIVKAVEHPLVDMIGHPTGRLLLGREAYELNMEEFLEAVKSNGKCLELNAHPHRLDVDSSVCRRAKEMGIMVSINPDAHKPEWLDYVRFGVWTARRGWLEKNDVLNTREADEMLALLKASRK